MWSVADHIALARPKHFLASARSMPEVEKLSQSSSSCILLMTEGVVASK